MFNARRYVQRAARNELLTDTFVSEPVPPGSHEPPGTLSQRIRYTTQQAELLAVAHQYLRPDGTIGGHGRPDPKILFTRGGILYSAHGDHERCADRPSTRRR